MIEFSQEEWQRFVAASRKNGVLIERIIKSFYRRLLRRDSIVIDVGAHVGYHTLGLAEKVIDGAVVACEASPSTYLQLLKSIYSHSTEKGRIFTINAAIQGDESKANVTFNYSEDHPGRSGLQKSWNGLSYTEHVVTSRTINSIVYGVNLPRVDFIKIDVEGSEFDVLLGAEETLVQFRSVVVAEHSTSFSKNLFDNWQAFADRVGYRGFFPNGSAVGSTNFNDYWYVFLFPAESFEGYLDLLGDTMNNYKIHVF